MYVCSATTDPSVALPNRVEKRPGLRAMVASRSLAMGLPGPTTLISELETQDSPSFCMDA